MSSLYKKLFGIYIHWPYCRSKCPYCDFFSLPCKSPDEEEILEGYLKEFDKYKTRKKVTSIFIGGGTPSMMSYAVLEKLFLTIRKNFILASDIEITLEANPNALDIAKMKFLKKLGVNRLSIGVQSLSDNDLKFLGRTHSVQEALVCIENAKRIFDNVNIDLIYARPNQTQQAWEEELKEALSLRLQHYSLYQLMIEEGTPFFKRQVQVPEEQQAINLYKLTEELTRKNKIYRYEVSNYAQQGFQCIHNLTYWLYHPYIGIGPSAQGRWKGCAIQNPRDIRLWSKGYQESEKLSEYEALIESILMNIRLKDVGIKLSVLDKKGVQKAIDYEWGYIKKGRFYSSFNGVLVLDQLLFTIIPQKKDFHKN